MVQRPRRQQQIQKRRGAPMRKKQRARSQGAQNFIRSRGFVLILLILLGSISLSVAREGYRRVQIAREIRDIQERIAVQQQRNAEMDALTKILNTSSAKEKQSRVSLNTIAPGEQVVVLHSKTNTNTATESLVLPNGQNVDTVSERKTESNPKKWIRYFFATNSN